MNTLMKGALALSALMTVPIVASTQTPDQRAEEQVRMASAEEVQALLASDTQRLSRIWADDFVVTNPLNKFANKVQVLGLITSGFLAFTSYDRQIEYVRAYGNTVVVAGGEIVVWAGKMPLAGKTSRLRFTSVWMRHADGWQEVARHANIVPER